MACKNLLIYFEMHFLVYLESPFMFPSLIPLPSPPRKPYYALCVLRCAITTIRGPLTVRISSAT
jgi:hypothetical protein